MSHATFIEQLAQAAERYDDWRELAPQLSGHQSSIAVHLAVTTGPFLDYILEAKKTIESRFSRNRIAPYQRIAIGDLVFLKAGSVVACFYASSVEFVELDERQHARLRRDYSDAICADEEFWRAREDKRYATLIGIADVLPLTPVRIAKRDRRGWLILRSSAHATAGLPDPS